MRIVLSGYYGFGNLGDEALLQVIVSQLRTRYPYAGINVLSAAPEQTAHELRVEATPRWDAGAVRRAVGNADVVLSGGGGLLQNATSLRSLVYYAGIVRAAIRGGAKTMIFAQSIGPLDFLGKTIVRECCKGLGVATVRDTRSRQLLAPLVEPAAVVRTADPVFLFDETEEAADLAEEGLGPQSDPLVIVSVRKATGLKERLELLAQTVDRLANTHGARVAFLPLGGAPDAEVSTQIIRKCKSAPVLLPEASPARAASIIRRAKAVIGMRLHALIFAARYAVPFLAIPYDPKVTALCDDLAYPFPPLVSLLPQAEKSGTPQALELLDRFWAQREALSEQLRNGIDTVRALAERNFDVLDTLISERPAST